MVDLFSPNALIGDIISNRVTDIKKDINQNIMPREIKQESTKIEQE